MSSKTNEALFELIKYLSKSEKRYFKIISSRHTIGDENNYIQLFDFLEQQETYDEEVLFKHFKGEAFLNRFSITKKRLYDHIINALDAFHAGASIDAQLFKLMHSADILYNKSLYEQSRRQLRSAEKLAIKHERFNLLSEISRKQKRLIESKGYSDENEILQILENDRIYTEQSNVYNELWNIKSRLFALLSNKGVSRTALELADFKILLDDFLLKTKEIELSFETKYLYHHTYSAYYYACGELENSLFHLKENILHLEQKKEYIEENPNRYFSILTNAIYIASKTKDFLLAQDYFKRLKNLTSNYSIQANEDFNIKHFSSSSSIEITLHVLKGQIQEAIHALPLIENGLKLYEEKLTTTRKLFLCFKIASVYFMNADYHSALKWINKILNEPELDEKEDLVSFTHILSVLIHFEMKNDRFIPYSLKNTTRFLKKRNRLYAVEAHFLKFITKAAKETNYFERESLFEQFYSELQHFEDNHFERIAFDYFDFVSWAKSKITQKSMSEIIKERVMIV